MRRIKHATRWFGLLLLLVGQLVGWICLMHSVAELPPEESWDEYKFNSGDNSVRRVSGFPDDTSDDRELALNLTSGEIYFRKAVFNPLRWRRRIGDGYELCAVGSASFLLRSSREKEQVASKSRVIECPGERHVVVNDRLLFGNDETSLYVWDSSRPEQPVQTISNPIAKPLEVLTVQERSNAVAWPTRPRLSYVIDSGAVSTYVGDPEDNESVDVETYFSSVPGTPKVQEIFLLSIATGGEQNKAECEVLRSWKALDNGTAGMTFPEPPAAVIDRFVVSVAPAGDDLEYRSLADGALEFVVPIPRGLDTASDRWRFHSGQLHVGKWGTRWLFDLQTRRRIEIPDGEAYCIHRYPEDQFAIFWRPGEHRSFNAGRVGQWVLMNERSGTPALVASSDRGYPVRIDDERIAFCSARYSYSAEVFNWKTRQTEKWVAPRRWLAPVLFMLTMSSFIWAALLLIQSRLNQVPVWFDFLALVLPFLALTFYWLYNFGSLEWRSTGIDSLLRQSVQSLFCSLLVVLIAILRVQAFRTVGKILIGMLSLACLGGVLRLALVDLPPIEYPPGVDFVILPSYNDFWITHGFLLLAVGSLSLTFSLLRLRGYRLVAGRKSAIGKKTHLAEKRGQETSAPRLRPRGTRIVDWMLLTAVVALCMQVYRPAFRDWEYMIDGFLFWLDPESLIGSLLSTALIVLAVIAAFSRSRSRFAVGASVAFLLALWTMLHPIANFVFARLPWYASSYGSFIPYFLVTPWMLFLFCSLLRMRGWQFSLLDARDQKCGERREKSRRKQTEAEFVRISTRTQ